jgi:predicted TIM-barrel fold metal-dependent hydrolase
MIIDCHQHRYTDEVLADPTGWAEVRGEHKWLALHVDRKRGRKCALPTRDNLLADMDAAGIDRAVLLGWYWENAETCEEQNGWFRGWLRESPDRLSAFAAVQPRAGDEALDSVRRAFDDGFSGIGEVFPAAQGFSNEDPVWMGILELAGEAGRPVTMHVTEPAGHRYAGKISAPLSDYERLAERFPEVKFIFAHWGGGLPFFELNRACRNSLRNVSYDTAASPLLYDQRVFKIAVELVGAEKILWGSDYPLPLYRDCGSGEGLIRFIGEAKSAGLAKGEMDRVFGGNASELLSLQ